MISLDFSQIVYSINWQGGRFRTINTNKELWAVHIKNRGGGGGGGGGEGGGGGGIRFGTSALKRDCLS